MLMRAGRIVKSHRVSSVKNEEVKSLFERIKAEFGTLREHVVASYQHDEDSPYVRRLDNLFKGLRDWVNNPKGRGLVHPAKIYDYNAKIKSYDRKHLSTVYHSMRDLDLKIHDIYSKDYDPHRPSIIFDVEAGQRGGRGKYRLKVTIGKEDFADIVRRITKPRTTQAPQEPPEGQKHILDQYLAQVERDSRYLDTRQIGIIPPVPISIESSYIHLKAILDDSQTEASYLTERLKLIIGEDLAREKRIAAKPYSLALPIEEILENVLKATDVSKRRMVFLGDCGSGKSTFLRYLTHLVASPKAEKFGLKGFIPIFVDLPRYSESKTSDFIEYCLNKTVKREDGIIVLKDFIESCENGLGEGYRVIFLLDAMDEVGDRRKDIAEEIESKADRYQNALFIVTSRKTGYYEVHLNNFSHYFVEDLTDEEIPVFIRTWFEIIAEAKAKDETGSWKIWSQNKANDLIKELDNKPSLKQIVTTPLYLTFLVLLASIPYTRLPETRADLFDRYFDALLVNWEEKHGLPLNKDALLESFNEISWIMHRTLFGDIQNDPTEEFIKKAIEKAGIVDARKSINFWIRAGVLLRTITEHQKILILPRHRSFIEYGFACKLAELWNNEKTRKALQKDLSRNLHNEYLHEPLLIFPGRLTNPASFIEYVRNLKDDLFHSNLIFLCEAIREAGSKSELKRVVSELLSQLQQIVHSRNPFSEGIQSEICKCMYLLGGKEVLRALLNEKSGLRIIIKSLRDIAPFCNKSIIPLLNEIHERANKKKDRQKVIECIAIVIGGEGIGPFFVDEDPELSARILLNSLFGLPKGPIIRKGVGIVRAYLLSKRKEAFGFLNELLAKSDIKIKMVNELLLRITRKLGKGKYEIGLSSGEPDGLITDSIRQAFLAGCENKSIIPYIRFAYAKETSVFRKRLILYALSEFANRSSVPYLKKIFDTENDIPCKIVIAYAIGKVGNVKTAIKLFKVLFNQADTSDQLIISKCVNDFNKEKLAVMQLNEMFRKRNSYHFHCDIIKEALNAAKKGELLIFSGRNGWWRLVEITKKYSFRSLSI